jgi:UDP-glucose 4-epimerase
MSERLNQLLQNWMAGPSPSTETPPQWIAQAERQQLGYAEFLDEPADLVIATGEAHTVREFCERAFAHAELGDWERYVEIDPRYYRPAEVDYLLGDSSKAREVLGWEPKTSFEELVRIMVDADVQLLDDELSGRLVRQDRDQ